jgi:uncharacterized protein YdaU (DUF1376 family)
MSGNDLAMMPWFPKDWVAATRLLSLAERGAYADLLFFQWEMVRLPAKHEALLRLLGVSASEFAEVWPGIECKFVVEGAFMYNERLEAHRSKSKQLKNQKSLAGHAGGIKSGEARRSKREANGKHAASVLLDDSLEAKSKSPSPSPSPSPSKSKEEEGEGRKAAPPLVGNGHEKNGHAKAGAWDDYPVSPEIPHRNAASMAAEAGSTEIERKRQWNILKADYPEVGGRVDWIGAEHAASKLVSDGFATWEFLYASVLAYKLYVQGTGAFVMNPSKFFTAEDKPWNMPWTIPEERTRKKPAARVAKSTAELEAEEAKQNAKH